MAGYLKEPVVLQWDMKTGSYGKIVQHIIEKKVCELDPADCHPKRPSVPCSAVSV